MPKLGPEIFGDHTSGPRDRSAETTRGLSVVRNRIDPVRHRLAIHTDPVHFYSVDLRDGLQGDAAMSPDARVEAATILNDVFPLDGSVGGIELGWPGANTSTDIFIENSKGRPYWSKSHVFGMTRHPGVHVEKDATVRALIGSEAPGITFVGKSSLEHIERKVLGEGVTPGENLQMIRDSVRYAKEQDHVERVYYDAEHFLDGYLYNPEYAMNTLYAAAEGGADLVVLCDTNGWNIPPVVGLITGDVVNDEVLHQKYRQAHGITDQSVKMPVGIHTHGDLKMAEANAIAAVMAGATHVQGVTNGFGERVGNLDTIPTILTLDQLGVLEFPDDKKRQLTDVSNTMFDLAELERDPNQPVTGRNAFRTAAGMHGDSTIKWELSYAGIDPQAVGNHFIFGIDENSGKSMVRVVMRANGITSEDETALASRVSKLVKENEAKGYRYAKAEASLYLLMRRQLPSYADEVPFTMDFHPSADGAEPTVSMTTNGHKYMQPGEELQPLEEESIAVQAKGTYTSSIMASLKDALRPKYPEVDDVELVNDSRKMVEGGPRVVVTARNGSTRWTVESIEDTLTSSTWKAVADALEYHIWQTRNTGQPTAA